MVSDQTQGLTPYELFQELKRISDEANQLFQRLNDLTRREGEVVKPLLAAALCPDSSVQLSGTILIDGVPYAYEFDPEDGFLLQFTNLPDLAKASAACTAARLSA